MFLSGDFFPGLRVHTTSPCIQWFEVNNGNLNTYGTNSCVGHPVARTWFNLKIVVDNGLMVGLHIFNVRLYFIIFRLQKFTLMGYCKILDHRLLDYLQCQEDQL